MFYWLMPGDVSSGVVFVFVGAVAMDAMIRLMPSREPGYVCFIANGNAYAFQASAFQGCLWLCI